MQNKFKRRKEQGNIRSLRTIKHLIDFASNDYLGLSRSTQLHQNIWKEWQRLEIPICGSTGSRLLTGNHLYTEELEAKIAEYHGFETGLLFNCGYMANVGLLSTVADPLSTVIFDSHIHASTRDGIRLSGCRAFPFKHNDSSHLENRLKNLSSRGPCYLCIESVYSTDGSIAPLEEICTIAARYEARVIVDEAHAVGILGPQGKGLVAEKKLTHKVFAQIVTFGKALGVQGAIVLGNRETKEYLINFSRPFIYTTALPLHLQATIKCAYDLLPSFEVERNHVAILAKKCQTILETSTTHIQPMAISGNHAVVDASKQLAAVGFDVRPLTSPTVQKGKEMLRICLHAFNHTTELESLLQMVLCLKSS